MAVFRIYEVMMGETLNYFVYNAVIMCSVIYFQAVYLIIALSKVFCILHIPT
jgi:hypothetical protein